MKEGSLSEIMDGKRLCGWLIAVSVSNVSLIFECAINICFLVFIVFVAFIVFYTCV